LRIVHSSPTLNIVGTYESVVADFSILIFAIMGLIVILILALITGTTLVRRRQELGIEKALGFTTWQLVRQISVGFLPVAVIGSLVGGIAGFYGANPLMSCLFRAMGIMKVGFYLPPLSVPVVCAVIALLTLLISAIAASRVRKISPCALVNE
jgi:putative ABC transport system permease protein